MQVSKSGFVFVRFCTFLNFFKLDGLDDEDLLIELEGISYY